jgi:hypothetical protein
MTNWTGLNRRVCHRERILPDLEGPELSKKRIKSPSGDYWGNDSRLKKPLV